MPIFFLFFALTLIISGAKGTQKDLAALVKEDFMPSDGSTSFGVWLLAILLVGAFGYIPGFKPVSTAFLVLIFAVMILSNRGVFNQFQKALVK